MIQFRRYVLEVADSYRNGDASCGEFIMVLEFQPKATGRALEGCDQLFLQLRGKTSLEGQSVGGERFQENRYVRRVVFDSFLRAKVRKGEGGFRIRKIRSKSIRLE